MTHEDEMLLYIVIGMIVIVVMIFLGGFLNDYYKDYKRNKAHIRMWGSKLTFTPITLDELKEIKGKIVSYQASPKEGEPSVTYFCGIPVKEIASIEIDYEDYISEQKMIDDKRKRIVFINKRTKQYGTYCRIRTNQGVIKYIQLNGYGSNTYTEIPTNNS